MLLGKNSVFSILNCDIKKNPSWNDKAAAPVYLLKGLRSSTLSLAASISLVGSAEAPLTLCDSGHRGWAAERMSHSLQTSLGGPRGCPGKASRAQCSSGGWAVLEANWSNSPIDIWAYRVPNTLHLTLCFLFSECIFKYKHSNIIPSSSDQGQHLRLWLRKSLSGYATSLS